SICGDTLTTVGKYGVIGATATIDRVTGCTPNLVNASMTTWEPGEITTLATGTPGCCADPSSTETSTLMSRPTSTRTNCTAYTGVAPSGSLYPSTRGKWGVHIHARRGLVSSQFVLPSGHVSTSATVAGTIAS